MVEDTVDRADGRYSRGIRRRTALLKAALRVAERSGVAAVGLRSVARECGVAPSSVGYHFSDRAVLLDALSRYTAAQFETRASEVAAGAVDPLDVVAAVVADSSALGRRRSLVEYELVLLAAREGRPTEPGIGWPRLLTDVVRLHMAKDPLAALRAADEIEGLRFRAVTGSRLLRTRDVRERIGQILLSRRGF